MNATNFLNDLLATATKKMNENKTCFGFGHGEYNEHQVKVSLSLVNTQSKNNQIKKLFYVDGKIVAAAKVNAALEAK